LCLPTLRLSRRSLPSGTMMASACRFVFVLLCIGAPRSATAGSAPCDTTGGPCDTTGGPCDTTAPPTTTPCPTTTTPCPTSTMTFSATGTRFSVIPTSTTTTKEDNCEQWCLRLPDGTTFWCLCWWAWLLLLLLLLLCCLLLCCGPWRTVTYYDRQVPKVVTVEEPHVTYQCGAAAAPCCLATGGAACCAGAGAAAAGGSDLCGCYSTARSVREVP